jgi:signal transduction histidine kinase
LVEGLLELIVFQTAARIKIGHSTQEGLCFRLPPQRFQRSLAELILNAAAAIGESEGAIQVEVVMEDDHLRVSVVDTGPGFPEELLLGASRPVDATRRGEPELGLATVRRFAREMGGKLEVSNQSSGGNASGGRATILLPCAAHHG